MDDAIGDDPETPRRTIIHATLATLLLLWPQAWPQTVQAQVVPVLPEQYLFDTWQKDQGLPQASVLAVVQDHLGYLWLGTEEGLLRFNGTGFTVFDRDNTPELESSHVGALLVDRDGALWIGTRGGLSRFEDGGFSRFDTADGLAHNDLRALYQDREGTLWIGTGEGLSRFAGATFASYTTRDGLIHDSVWSIAGGQDGGLWIGTEGGLSRFKDGRFTSYTRDQGLSHEYIQALYEDRRGRLWIGTREGLDYFEDGRLLDYDFPTGRLRPWVYAFHEDSAGHLWIGTDNGLKRLRDGVLTSYTTDDGLPDDEVRAIQEDREGSLWIGTRHGGLGRLIQGKFTNFGTPEGLVNDVVWSIYQDRAGNVWIGTNDGLTQLGTDGTVTNYTARDGLPGTDVRSLYEDRRGNLWIGTYAHGLVRLRHGEFFRYTADDGLAAAGVLGLQEDRHGRLWIATDGGGLSWFEDGEFGTYTTKDGLPHDTVKGIYEDRQGVLWFGTEGGIALYEDGAFLTMDRADGLADERVRAFYEDADGSLWIGTREGGLSRFRDGVFVNFAVRDGLFDHGLHRILEDGEGRLWITSNKGIFHVRKRELDDFAAGRASSITSVAYSESDGLRSSESNGGTNPAGWKTRDGRLWFPTIKGVAVVDPDLLEINEVPPPVHIEEVIVDNDTLGSRKGGQWAGLWLSAASGLLELPHGTRELEIRYVALSFLAPEKIRFKYQLEGFAADWVDAGSRRSAFYTNLDPGSYRFRVIASNSDGVWNEEGASIRFTIRPPPWQTWWAFALYGVAIAAATASIVRWQQTRVERERAVSRRLRAIDKLKDEFLANTSHELRTPLFGITGLAESLIDGARGELPAPAKADLSMLVASGRRLGALVDDILDFSKLKHRSLSLDQKPVDLHALTDVVLALSRPLAGSKDLIVENAVPRDLSPANADENRLQQILHNLVGNAIKFTDSGSVEVTAEERQHQLLVHVADTGIGIPTDQQDHIFRAFEQADTSVEREYGGVGLGLAVTRRLVDLHGGALSVESTPGKGSVFSFTLPVAVELEAPSTESARAAPVIDAVVFEPSAVEIPQGHRGSASILVVDDEPVNRQVLFNLLTAAGYRIESAVSGPEALARIEHHRPDLVLLDVMMPRVSGYEVCRVLREIYSLEQLPVILLTAKGQPADLVTGLAAGANDYLRKPVSRSELLARVQTHLALLDVHRQLARLLDERTVQLEERERLLGERQRLISELESRNAELASFNYTIAHDLKNPLTTIKTFIGLLEKDATAGDQDRLQHDLRRIGKAADKLHRLLDQLYELSQIEAPRERFEDVPFGELVSLALDALSDPIAARGVVVEVEPDLPAIRGNRTRLQDAIRHLLENAIGYLDDRSTPKIWVGARTTCSETVFFVRDNGIGIDPRYHEKVFGLFERLNAEDSDRTGVGLALVKRVMEVHGGKIWVESEGAGHGSSFCFTLPREANRVEP